MHEGVLSLDQHDLDIRIERPGHADAPVAAPDDGRRCWSLLVICILADGVRRFSELRREIDGISQRMLTLTLRQLEREGLVDRKVFPVVPPRVDYKLTPLGSTLLDTIQSLVAWAGEHGNEIAAACAAYDARAADERAASVS